MTLDELDALHAADAEKIREELRTTGRHYTEPHEYLHNAWPAFSARLRAAEAEVERLRGALRGAIEELDTIPEDPKRFARVAGMTIPLVRGGLAKALLPAKARAALGEP